MAEKQELIDEAIWERKEKAEYNFKYSVQQKLDYIIKHQQAICEAEAAIKLIKKQIKELEIEPFDEHILKEEGE